MTVVGAPLWSGAATVPFRKYMRSSKKHIRTRTEHTFMSLARAGAIELNVAGDGHAHVGPRKVIVSSINEIVEYL